MFFLDADRAQIINTDRVERFRVDKKDDGALVTANYSVETRPVTIGRYQTIAEAIDVLRELHKAISDGLSDYVMPVSTGNYIPPEENRPRNGHNGKKPIRHGGS